MILRYHLLIDNLSETSQPVMFVGLRPTTLAMISHLLPSHRELSLLSGPVTRKPFPDQDPCSWKCKNEAAAYDAVDSPESLDTQRVKQIYEIPFLQPWSTCMFHLPRQKSSACRYVTLSHQSCMLITDGPRAACPFTDL